MRSRATKTPPGVTALWIVVAIVTYMAIDSIRWGYTLGWFLLIGVLPFIAIFIYSIFKEKKPPREDRKYVPKWEPTIIYRKSEVQSEKKSQQTPTTWRRLISPDIWLPEDHIKRLLSQIIPTFIDSVKSRYPLIPFDFPEGDTLLRNPPWGNNPITKPATKVIEMALKQTLVAIARKDYKEHSPDLEITDCCPRDLVPQSFWNHERKNRATDKNGLPRDWSKRKILVHGRDKCCKRCGLSLTLDECHIHHITMRGYAGDHALRNLVTLCRSCHSLMPGHYDMRFEHVPTDPGHSKQKKFWPLDIDVYMAKTVPDMVVSAIVQHNVTNKPIS